MHKGSPACAGQLIKCHQHQKQLKFAKCYNCKTKMHKNAFSAALSGSAGGPLVLPRCLAAAKREETRRGMEKEGDGGKMKGEENRTGEWRV